MAKEEPKAAEAAADAAPAKPKLPILIGMVAVGLAVGGGTGAAVLGPMVAKKFGKAPAAQAAHGEAAAAAEGEHAAPAEHGEKAAEGKAGEGADAPVYVLDNLVLNPANSGGSRFLLLTVAIEVSGTSVQDAFKKRDAELRDIVLTALGPKTIEQLTNIAMRETFKTELSSAINAQFGKQAVKRLYFPQFVVQ